MPLPDEKDTPPAAAELKALQGYAGEFNWLATRTRGDLAYFTSIIASAATKHGNWTFQLCKKVLRYCVAQQRNESGFQLEAMSGNWYVGVMLDMVE